MKRLLLLDQSDLLPFAWSDADKVTIGSFLPDVQDHIDLSDLVIYQYRGKIAVLHNRGGDLDTKRVREEFFTYFNFENEIAAAQAKAYLLASNDKDNGS